MMARGAADLSDMEHGGGVRRWDDKVSGARGWDDDDENHGGRGEGGKDGNEEEI